MAEFVEREESVVLAIQFKDNNVNNVISWLEHLNIQYSYDEIKSGGDLIVYDPNDGPRIVENESWVVIYKTEINRDDKSVSVWYDKEFNSKFIIRSV